MANWQGVGEAATRFGSLLLEMGELDMEVSGTRKWHGVVPPSKNCSKEDGDIEGATQPYKRAKERGLNE